jgi:hypothetical protein
MFALKKGHPRQFEPFVEATVMVRLILKDSFTQIVSFHNHPQIYVSPSRAHFPCLHGSRPRLLSHCHIRRNAILCFQWLHALCHSRFLQRFCCVVAAHSLAKTPGVLRTLLRAPISRSARWWHSESRRSSAWDTRWRHPNGGDICRRALRYFFAPLTCLRSWDRRRLRGRPSR